MQLEFRRPLWTSRRVTQWEMRHTPLRQVVLPLLLSSFWLVQIARLVREMSPTVLAELSLPLTVGAIGIIIFVRKPIVVIAQPEGLCMTVNQSFIFDWSTLVDVATIDGGVYLAFAKRPPVGIPAHAFTKEVTATAFLDAVNAVMSGDYSVLEAMSEGSPHDPTTWPPAPRGKA